MEGRSERYSRGGAILLQRHSELLPTGVNMTFFSALTPCSFCLLHSMLILSIAHFVYFALKKKVEKLNVLPL